MSYSVEWIEPIYDRTYGDVITAEGQRNLVNPKGCYNYIDLNRIENNTKYVMEDMLARKIIRVPPALAIKLNWVETDIPTSDDMSRIIGNITTLMSVSNPIIFEDFDIIYNSTQFTYSLANAIEKNLERMKNQPLPPVKDWLLKVEHGIIVEYNASSAYIAEEEIVHIKAISYGQDAQYMEFEHWSGNTDDLQYVGDVNASPTTYKMVYHDSEDYIVEITANFKTKIPRTLKLNGGRVYDAVGGSTRQFFAGDEVLILANASAVGKRFYEWRGTQEGIDNLTGGPEPSTSWLTMPDCNVELTSFYINAGQHSVTVDGTIQGWYDYGEIVSIYPGDRGSKYVFNYWSGDTGYLEDTKATSFTMPDVNVKFTSNWRYIPDQYQLVVNNGNGSGVYNDNATVSISADTPPEGQGFYYWSLDEGYGTIEEDWLASTRFRMTTSNAVITAHFNPLRTIIRNNYNNSGTPITSTVVQGKSYVVDTNDIVGDKIFDYWLEGGSKILSRYFTITVGSTNRTFTAVYRNRNTYTLTVNSGSGSGQYLEKATVAISANTPPSGKRFKQWNYSNIASIDNRYSSSTTIVMSNSNGSVTAVYEDIPGEKIYHTMTVNNGGGSGSYYEGQSITCRGNQAPATYEFSHWEENGSVISYANPFYTSMGTSDRTITAVYKPIPYFTVTIIDGTLENGKTSGTFLRNSQPKIMMNPAPEGMKFLQWEIIQGDNNDVLEPLAEVTYIRNLTHNTTVKATYYVPDTETPYYLSITNKEGKVTTTGYHIGDTIDIYADDPDDGYKFYKWTGDTQYLIDRFATPTVVNMPGRNIALGMEYRREGFVTTHHVLLYGGEVLVETNPETGEEKWDIEGEFEELAEVRIRAIDIPLGWKFNGWKNEEDGGKSMSTVNDLTAAETFLRVEDFPITLTRDVIEKEKYDMKITNGEISGSYYDGDPVPIYFNLENTDNMHYQFVRWSGTDTSYLRLFEDGAIFDITNPGTPTIPQTIRMPARNINISAIYNMAYKLSVGDTTHGYYEAGTKIQLSAEEIEGKRFTYWTGDTSYLDNKYNPNVTLTMPNRTVKVTPNYHNINNNNSIGYSLTSLSNNDTINIEDIVIISGEISVGFVITDSNGHMYVVTNVVGNEVKIVQLTTTIVGGDESGQ